MAACCSQLLHEFLLAGLVSGCGGKCHLAFLLLEKDSTAFVELFLSDKFLNLVKPYKNFRSLMLWTVI